MLFLFWPEQLSKIIRRWLCTSMETWPSERSPMKKGRRKAFLLFFPFQCSVLGLKIKMYLQHSKMMESCSCFICRSNQLKYITTDVWACLLLCKITRQSHFQLGQLIPNNLFKKYIYNSLSSIANLLFLEKFNTSSPPCSSLTSIFETPQPPPDPPLPLQRNQGHLQN